MTVQLAKPKLSALRELFARLKQIERALVFGARAKATARPDSDLDVALEISGSPEKATVTWIENAESWRGEVATALDQYPTVDLQCAFPDDECVMPAVVEHGVLIFERNAK